MTTETADYRWWLTGETVPANWHARVTWAIHAQGAEECACETGDEHNFMLESYTDDAVYALEASAPLAADAERKRVLGEFRERIKTDRGIFYEFALDYGERGMDAEEHRYFGRVAQCDDLLKAMDAMEAAQ